MINDIFVIIIIGVIFYTIDISTANKSHYKTCINNKLIQLELLLHHILNIYAQFGWVSNNKYLLYGYVITPLLVLSHWSTNNNKCYLTEDINKKCNIDKNVPFRDMWYLIGIKNIKYYDTCHKLYLIIGWLIALYKIKYSLP